MDMTQVPPAALQPGMGLHRLLPLFVARSDRPYGHFTALHVMSPLGGAWQPAVPQLQPAARSVFWVSDADRLAMACLRDPAEPSPPKAGSHAQPTWPATGKVPVPAAAISGLSNVCSAAEGDRDA